MDEVESCANEGCTTSTTGKLLLCARCESVKYCSVECQKQHWENCHKSSCNEKFPVQPTELLPYTLVYYVVDQISHIRSNKKDRVRTAEFSLWVIDFLQYQFGLPIAGQWKRPKRERLLRELPAKATWPTSEEIQQIMTNEAKERIKDGLLRREIKAALIAGTNVSSRSPLSELHTMMRVEGEIMGRERQRNLVLESQWPTYKEGRWLESPLAMAKDLEPDNFECDACLRYTTPSPHYHHHHHHNTPLTHSLTHSLTTTATTTTTATIGTPRYSEYVVLASSYKDQQRCQEALPWALQSLALLEPWDQQFELPLELRADNYGAKFWDEERENLLQCMTITHSLICQIYGQLHQFDTAEEHGLQAINYAQLMETDQQSERLYAAYVSLSTIPSAPFLAKVRGEMDDGEGYTKATEYSTLAYETILDKDGPVNERVLKAGHTLVESLVEVAGDFVQAEHYCRSLYLAIVGSDLVNFDQNVSQDYLLAAVAGNQLASLCWRSAHVYAVYALHHPDDNEDEEEPSPVVEAVEAEAFCRQTMDLIQPQFDEDSAPVAQHALECLGNSNQN